MSKTHKMMKIDLEKAVMIKVKSNEISMKPRLYFILGSCLAIVGLIGLSVLAVFLTNLMLFLLRQHGPMGQWRLQSILDNFSWWIPILTILGIVGGIRLLKKYDFSYKKNFWFIIFGFIISIILAACILDYSGLNDIWSRQGPMRGFYQQINNQNIIYPKGQGQGRMQNGQGIRSYNQIK